MKKQIKKTVTSLFILGGLLVTGCNKTDDYIGNANPMGETVLLEELITVPLFIEDENGAAPASPETMLFETRMHNPITDTEGKQISFEDFDTVKGSVELEEMEGGTKINMNLTGLIPNGMYTIWNVTFQAPGFDPSVEGMNLIGLGAMGKTDGSENSFRASESGTGQISAFNPKGSLSMLGKISEHPMTEEAEWHLVGAYHIDDKSYGPDLGPDGTVVEQFAFIFKN